jgi:hypothetical protein
MQRLKAVLQELSTSFPERLRSWDPKPIHHRAQRRSVRPCRGKLRRPAVPRELEISLFSSNNVVRYPIMLCNGNAIR